MADPQATEKPLVYSCSGCSNIAQLANQLAIDLDREQLAEMSCIAGIGGGVEPLVKKARSGRRIIALDGCQLHCVKNCLKQRCLQADLHYTLSEFGIRKRYHMDFDKKDLAIVKQHLMEDLTRAD
ncbi:putative zinc-binding protein [Bacterioplanoides sp. SCSIO 12839]|uniref:putative zinc-binding protein n=1 Tax=Bacterioplanoides sp. SCSIO 12839 TaxID=2829569 RepID=UPI0021057614|nr:putative zinc-binding protein [Bacterioplanoides sp. SCSIO 12839]UTW49326.1 putative zinc-binding protein [Bacterioplanoides sp. SCSIO 12839]